MFQWLNKSVKNSSLNLKDKIVSRYMARNAKDIELKSTDINILLNRVKVNQKNESRKKIYFSIIASVSIFLFGYAIF